MILSVIIPVYNTGKYLERCVNSCVNQNLSSKEFEVIIVNDGSTDNSLSVALEISEKNDNVIVLNQRNQRQGAARNHGLKKATGEYIWFVDSDDWVEENFFKKLMNFTHINNPDIVRFDAVDFYPETSESIKRKAGHQPKRVYQNTEAFIENQFLVCVPFHLFKRTFLIEKEIFFPEGIFYEDNFFTTRAFLEVDKFQYFPYTGYYVNKRSDSTTRTHILNRKLDLLKVIEKQLLLFSKLPDNQYVKRTLGIRISTNFNSVLLGVAPSPELFSETVSYFISLGNLKEVIYSYGRRKHQLEFQFLKFPNLLRQFLILYYH